MSNIPHVPVLPSEVLDIFKDLKEGIFIDATVGYGGHSEIILKNFDKIKLVGIDRDDEALAFSNKRLESYKDRFELKKGRFSEVIKDIDFSNVVGILADIGVSSLQLDKNERGFGFLSDVLDMRMDRSQNFSAKDVVNSYNINELERIFRDYGEERAYKKIARAIAEYRKNKKFESTKELSELIKKTHSLRGIHPATKIFQAIRIEVNDELGEIERFLDAIYQKHSNNLKVAIISFHSLEDKIIKNKFKFWTKSCICPPDNFKCECGNNNSKGIILTKKPLTASKEEIKTNPRSRSAKLRAFKFN